MNSPSLLTFTVMKNEGPFVLEWIAYQRMMGVDEILVFTNDCDDGTDALLDRLDDMGHVQHLPNPISLGPEHITPRARPHITGIAYARLTKAWREADYIFLSDVDEFPVIRTGDKTLKALLQETDYPDAISISERLFGMGDIFDYEDKPLTGSFLMSDSVQPNTRFARRGLKSVVRNCPAMDIRNHRPLPASRLSEDEISALCWLDGSGQRFPNNHRIELMKGTDCRGCTDIAEVFHYSLRSLDSYLVKQDRGDAVIKNEKPRRALNYYRSRDRTSEFCDEMLPKQEAILEGIAALKADPLTRELHEKTVEKHRAKAQMMRATSLGQELETIANARAARMQRRMSA